MKSLGLLAAALMFAAGCSGTKTTGDAGVPDSGTPDAWTPDAGPAFVPSNTVVGDVGFEVLSTDSAFGPLPDGGPDPSHLAGFLFDHSSRCGGGGKPADAGVYVSVGFYLATPDLPSIPLGSYQCGANAPLGGGHVKLDLTYLVEEVGAGGYQGAGYDFTSCTLDLIQVGSNAKMQGRFQGSFSFTDGGTHTLSGTFDTTPCPPGAN